MAAYCEHCGSPLPPDARFCETCGHRVSAPSSPAITFQSTAPLPSTATRSADIDARDGGGVYRVEAVPLQGAEWAGLRAHSEPQGNGPARDTGGPPPSPRRRWIGPLAGVGLLLGAAALWLLRSDPAPDRPYYLEAPVFADEFSDPGTGWEVWSNDRSSAGYEGGQLHLRQSAPGTMAVSRAGRSFDDLAMEVDAAPLALPPGSSYGLFVGFDGSDTYGMLEVSAQDAYRIVNVQNGAAELIADWTPLPALAERDITRFLAMRDGGALTFSLNGTLVPEFISDYSAGDLALFVAMAETGATGPVHVAFDDLRLWIP